MTTREALAAMTDRGDFESLATAVLRVIEPDCTALIHHGVNAQGEPVKAPLDAWCQVPQSAEPRFVHVQHTTTDRKSLRGKWLGSKGGDLPKSALQATELRKQFPDAKFRLFLTTNFVPETELQRDVYLAGSKAGLEVVIIDQSRLADYLDKPEGQYLRRNVLKIEADSLSRELLDELCRTSAERHEQRFLSGEIPVRIERETDRQVRVALRNPAIALHCLVADAGLGKSTTAHLILTEHIGTGGHGLWISESVLAHAMSMEDAINRTLCSLHPGLSSETASAWRTICGEKRLLLVVDDINPVADREVLLRKLQGWTAPSESKSIGASSRGFVALCPVWTHVWDATRDPNKTLNWLSATSLGPMLPAEAVVVIERLAATSERVVTEEQASECAEKLNCDPYLLGIFGLLLKENVRDIDPVELTKDVVPKYLRFVLRNAASHCNGAFTLNDFEKALAAMSTQMLLRKSLRPNWSQMRAWLKESEDSHVCQAAEVLRRDAVVCRLVDGDALVFRHDRLLQHLLSASISNLFDAQEVAGDVFYAELLGQSLATGTISDETLATIAEKNPLALFEAIRVIRIPSTTFHRKIIDAVMLWVRRPEMPNAVPEALRFAVGSTLMQTDSPVVLEIARFLPPDFGVLAACLRNGSAWAGVCLIGESGRASFDPAVRHTWRAPALNHAIRNFRKKLVADLEEILWRSNLTYEQSLGAILLSGYLGESILADRIVACCEEAKNHEFLLAETIWAVGRCCGKNAAHHLKPLFKLLENVSDEKVERDWSRRDGIARKFQDFPTDTFHVDAVAYIIRVADKQPGLRDVLYPLIHGLDTPDAFEHLALYKAERAKARGNDEVSMLDFVFSKWERTHRDRYGPPCEASLLRLRTLWQSDDEDRVVRSAAFRIWSWSCDASDIPYLQTVSVGSPIFRSALWDRAKLGDQHCIPELARCLRNDAWLSYVAHHVWSPELSSVVEVWLAGFVAKTLEKPGYAAGCFGDLLTHIPANDGERLLKTFWRGLREHCAFVQAALLISSPATLALADEAIHSKTVEEPFAHLALKMNDLRQKAPGWSAARFLRGLEPYLGQLSPDELWHYPLDCRWAGEADWCRQHIMPRLPDEKRRQHFADDFAIASEIEAVAKDDNRWRFSKFAFESLLRNEADPRRIIELATAAFKGAPSLRRYTILAESVAELGNRSDIPLLEQQYGKDWTSDAERFCADARFRICRRTLGVAS